MCYMFFTSVEWGVLSSPTLQILLLCRADHCAASYQVSHRSSWSCLWVSVSSVPLLCLPSRCMSTILSPKHSQGLQTSRVQHPPTHLTHVKSCRSHLYLIISVVQQSPWSYAFQPYETHTALLASDDPISLSDTLLVTPVSWLFTSWLSPVHLRIHGLLLVSNDVALFSHPNLRSQFNSLAFLVSKAQLYKTLSLSVGSSLKVREWLIRCFLCLWGC